MTDSPNCPQCGRDVPPGSPGGLCPTCLIAQAAPPRSAALTPPTTGFTPPAPDELASLFPQLEILEVIGHGGMGAVYKARQPKLDRLVALKIIRPESAGDPAFAERFNREARTLARLSHPGIVGVYDFGEVQLQSEAGHTPDEVLPSSQPYYFIMEYVEGVNLRQLLEDGHLRPEQALEIIPQTCDALQYAHEEGVIHRDIKPENILLDTRGRVKIADFGLAKLASRTQQDFTLTATHQVMGTPRYMAPEQMEGSHAVDHRADIYSLGVVFYEMLTGQVPAGHFEAPSKHVSIDARLDDVVLRALSRSPEKRFQQAGDISSAVCALRDSAGSPSAPPLPGPSTILDRAVAGVVDRFRNGWQAIGKSAPPSDPTTPTVIARDSRLGGADWVTLSRTQIETDDLPNVCIVCGTPTTERLSKDFEHQPDWAQVLTLFGIFCGVFPGIIIASLTSHRQRIACPVCPQHRNHWSRFAWWAGLGWLIPIVLGGLGGLTGAILESSELTSIGVAGPLVGFGIGLGVVIGLAIYLVPLIRMASSRVDVEFITDGEIRIRRVAAEFARQAARRAQQKT